MTSSTDELPYWLALLRAPTIGPITFKKILNVFSLRDLFKTKPSTLNLDKWPPALAAYIKNPAWKEVEADLRWLEQSKTQTLLMTDSHYPKQLKEIADAPPLLFIQGQPDVLHKPQIAIVGSRNPSKQGEYIASKFAAELWQYSLVTTSGLALGIDAASHNGVLKAGGETIAVMATGCDLIYPRSNQALADKILSAGSTLVSEFLPRTKALAENFPRRNRIISGLALGVLVVEAALQSGSLITARYANEQGREVFAIPSSIMNPLAKGCHFLLRQGAKLVECIADILEELKGHYPLKKADFELLGPQNKSIGLAKEHRLLVECLNYESTSAEELIVRSGLTPNRVMSLLLELELKGEIISVAGGYARVIVD